MKIRSYRMLFRFFSYLSDKTNGASFFVKYKLMLGTLIIGLTGVSCNKAKQAASHKDTIRTDSSLVQIGKQNAIDSVKNASNQKLIPPVIEIDASVDPEPIMCYVGIETEVTPEKESLPEIYLYGTTEVPPVWAEGDLKQFTNWVQGNIQYPTSMLEEEVQGRVIASFIIDEEGKLTDITILRSLSPDADYEVLRALYIPSLWTPGEVKGRKIKTKITIPVTFKLPQN